MRKAFLVLVVLVCAVGIWAVRPLFKLRCQRAMAPQVVVTSIKSNGYVIDNTRSFRVLTALHGHTEDGAFVLGLTRAQGMLEIEHRGALIRDPLSDCECLAPRIDVAMVYPPIVINVGSEFAPGTCVYQEVLAHEMRHLKTYLDNLPTVERTVQRALQARFAGAPLYARTGQASAALKREIDTGWMPYVTREMARVEVQQAAIDSPAEYARLSKICKGEVQSLIGSANRTR